MFESQMSVAQRSDRSPFGKLLREMRREAGLSQEALAERALMSVDTISALERGTSQAPQRETLAALVSALDLDADQRSALEALAVRPGQLRSYAEDRRAKTNLPLVSQQLYGRERETEAVKALIMRSPLVALTGAGGVGKTSLAQRVGREVLDDFTDGVWFVDLAPLSNIQGATRAIAALFGVRESADHSLEELLTHVLQRKHVLLIVDNCEHLIEGVAGCVESLMQGCPNLHVLATSRQSLNIPNEHTYRVNSLEVEAATTLFAEHAKRASEAFPLDAENTDVVHNIVRALDGIPLAIELAAARTKLLSPHQIADRLSERLRLLTGGSQTKLPRQQTMRATLDWSYELLSPREQLLFARLAVFAGGFSLDAAEFVCSDAEADECPILELLASLVNKSLVISEPAGNDAVIACSRACGRMRSKRRKPPQYFRAGGTPHTMRTSPNARRRFSTLRPLR